MPLPSAPGDVAVYLASLTNEELVAELRRLADAERAATVLLLAALGESETRRLYLEAGCASLFTYCTEVLHLSEHAAYRRIQAARAARTFPVILERLANGSLTLTAVGLLASHLTPSNCLALIDKVRHRTRRQIEQILADLAPKPDAPETIRRLPTPRGQSAFTLREQSPSILREIDASASSGSRPAAQERGAEEPPDEQGYHHVEGHDHAPQERGPQEPGDGHGCHHVEGHDHAPQERGPQELRGLGAPTPTELDAPTPHELVAAAPRWPGVHSPDGVGASPHSGPSSRAATIATETVNTSAPVLPVVLRRSERPAIVVPLTRERYKIQLTVGAETHSKLRRVQDLMRHIAPDGNLEIVFDRAITLLLGDLERKRLAAVLHPRDSGPPPSIDSRYLPAGVRRAVWLRDSGRCAFVGSAGRCRETGLLQFHHKKPFAAGGETTVENLELRCAAHNAFEAAEFFGPRQSRRHASRSDGSVPMRNHSDDRRASGGRVPRSPSWPKDGDSDGEPSLEEDQWILTPESAARDEEGGRHEADGQRTGGDLREDGEGTGNDERVADGERVAGRLQVADGQRVANQARGNEGFVFEAMLEDDRPQTDESARQHDMQRTDDNADEEVREVGDEMRGDNRAQRQGDGALADREVREVDGEMRGDDRVQHQGNGALADRGVREVDDEMRGDGGALQEGGVRWKNRCGERMPPLDEDEWRDGDATLDNPDDEGAGMAKSGCRTGGEVARAAVAGGRGTAAASASVSGPIGDASRGLAVEDRRCAIGPAAGVSVPAGDAMLSVTPGDGGAAARASVPGSVSDASSGLVVDDRCSAAGRASAVSAVAGDAMLSVAPGDRGAAVDGTSTVAVPADRACRWPDAPPPPRARARRTWSYGRATRDRRGLPPGAALPIGGGRRHYEARTDSSGSDRCAREDVSPGSAPSDSPGPDRAPP